MRNLLLLTLAAMALSGCELTSWKQHPAPDPHVSGGVLREFQARYDVTHYGLSLKVDPEARSIHGAVEMRARVVEPLGVLSLDLDPLLAVKKVEWIEEAGTRELRHERRRGEIVISFPRLLEAGEEFALRTTYGGQPRVAPRPPWKGGFTWAKTPEGLPWIATSCQLEGPDLWWPVKDHVSDEPETMALHFTVPTSLVVASNGRRVAIEPAGEGWHTYHFEVSSPINNYTVAFNAAPYVELEREYTSITGENFPVVFHVLPSDREKGEKLLDEIIDHLRFFEEELGPYPFRSEKYGVVQTPHLGMEHQTVIAYGANFDNGAMTGGVDWGFDVLHHHELSHEWWGNLVTNSDWSDMWLHEGFGTWMQARYLERVEGPDRYREYLESLLPRVPLEAAVAPPAPASTAEVNGGAIYFKGAWVLHTLRYLVGDEVFFESLRRFAYPTDEHRKATDGSQCRHVTTADYRELVEELSGLDLAAFFEVYVHGAALPRLETVPEVGHLGLRWVLDGGPADFAMPVPVVIDGEEHRIPVSRELTRLPVPEGAEVVVDPGKWILREELRRPRPDPDS